VKLERYQREVFGGTPTERAENALSVSYNKVGDVQMAQGNLPAALTSYQAGLAIAERLAKSDAVPIHPLHPFIK
jgi:hypothetical protein